MTEPKVTKEEMRDTMRILEILANRAPRCFNNREAIGLTDEAGPILKTECQAIRALIKRPKAGEVIANLMKACGTLMDEVCKQKATDWGIVNDAMVAGDKYLNVQGKKEE